MLDHRLRRRSKIKQTLVQRVVFANNVLKLGQRRKGDRLNPPMSPPS